MQLLFLLAAAMNILCALYYLRQARMFKRINTALREAVSVIEEVGKDMKEPI